MRNWVKRFRQRHKYKCLGSNGLARQADARSKKRPARRLGTRDSSRFCRNRGSNCHHLQRLRPEQRFPGQRQRDDDHGRGGVQGRRNRDPVGAARRPVGIPSAVKTATMIRSRDLQPSRATALFPEGTQTRSVAGGSRYFSSFAVCGELGRPRTAWLLGRLAVAPYNDLLLRKTRTRPTSLFHDYD